MQYVVGAGGYAPGGYLFSVKEDHEIFFVKNGGGVTKNNQKMIRWLQVLLKILFN